MQYIKDESLTSFVFWSGALDHAKLLTYAELKELDKLIPDFFRKTPTETEINDLFWFGFECVCDLIGTTEEEVYAREEE